MWIFLFLKVSKARFRELQEMENSILQFTIMFSCVFVFSHGVWYYYKIARASGGSHQALFTVAVSEMNIEPGVDYYFITPELTVWKPVKKCRIRSYFPKTEFTALAN